MRTYSLIILILQTIGITLACEVLNPIRLLRNSDLFFEPREISDKHTTIKIGETVKVLCQTHNAENKTDPSVWSKVEYEGITGFVPYARMERTERWLPGAGMCKCTSPKVLALDDAKMNHTEATQYLKGYNFTVSCSNSPGTNCPTFNGVRRETIRGLVNFKGISNCSAIQIVGGTEVEDTASKFSHKNGFRLDINLDPCIADYIKQNFIYIGKREYGSPDPLYVACSGNTIAKKNDRWEMTAYVGGGSQVACLQSPSNNTENNSALSRPSSATSVQVSSMALLALAIIYYLYL